MRGNNIKKIIILLILVVLLSGCGTLTLPNDLEFLFLINQLDTPEKICHYMLYNFIYEPHLYYTLNPYELYQQGKGDCNDFSGFASFIANYHGYETFQIIIYFKETIFKHAIAVYKENGKYDYSTNTIYFPIQVETLKEVVEDYDEYDYRYEVKKYRVYDYKMEFIEQGAN